LFADLDELIALLNAQAKIGNEIRNGIGRLLGIKGLDKYNYAV
jgi:hypothetical protein